MQGALHVVQWNIHTGFIRRFSTSPAKNCFVNFFYCHFACTEMILSYHLLLNRPFSTINWYLSRHCLVVCVVFWFVCFCFCVFVSFLCLVLCLVLVFVCFSVFCLVFWMNVTVHRTMYRSSTSLLLRPLQQRPLRDLINQLIPNATCFETC